MNPPTAITYDLILEKKHIKWQLIKQQEAETNYAENEADDTSKIAFRFIIGRNQREEDPVWNMAPISLQFQL